MDLNHLIGTDLLLDNTGDLALVVNPTEGQQRVLRRLLTNPGDYLWHLNYGAGLARFIGKPMNEMAIGGTIKQQMKLEQAVVQSPPPAINIQYSKIGEVVASIQYIDADSNLTSSLTLPLNIG